MTTTPRSPDWNHIRAFLATAEAGSLSAGARELGLTQPTLSRQVAALEAELGVMLFERVGRTLALTQAGLELLEHTRDMGQAANKISLTASGQSQAIDGEIRITAADIYSAHMLRPALEELREIAPALRINVIAANDIRDLMRREADIAVRHVRPDQPDLVARLAYEAKAYFYASESYLQRFGQPKSFKDLSEHQFVAFGDAPEMVGFFTPLGLDVTPDHFPIGSNNGLVAWQMSKDGFGISVMGSDVAAQSPEMVNLFPDMEPIEFPVWLVTHREVHTSRKIRLVFDLLAKHLSALK